MERNQPSQPQLFHCPTCGASLPVPDAASIRCEYCGSNVLVPPEYRNHKETAPIQNNPQVIVQLAGADNNGISTAGRRSIAGIIGFITVFIIICVIISAVLSATGVLTATSIFGSVVEGMSTQVSVDIPTTIPAEPTAIPTATQTPPVQVDLLFGGEGSGPGQFDDPRYVAIDPQGNIFVADYSDGRIQKFDPEGKFLQLINVEPDRNENTLIRSMAADYKGSLYIARGGDLLIYNTNDGTLAGTIPGQFPDLNHDQVVIDPANNIYAVNTASGDDALVKYDSQGKLLWEKAQILQGIAPKNTPAGLDRITVDGLGNIFILNSFVKEIYKFDTDGNFLDRFGSKGEELQQFNNPDSMAIDGKGRIFVVDSNQGYLFKVFDNQGTFLQALPWPDALTFPRMILFDVNGNLITVTNTNQVARMSILPGVLKD